VGEWPSGTAKQVVIVPNWPIQSDPDHLGTFKGVLFDDPYCQPMKSKRPPEKAAFCIFSVALIIRPKLGPCFTLFIAGQRQHFNSVCQSPQLVAPIGQDASCHWSPPVQRLFWFYLCPLPLIDHRSSMVKGHGLPESIPSPLPACPKCSTWASSVAFHGQYHGGPQYSRTMSSHVSLRYLPESRDDITQGRRPGLTQAKPCHIFAS